MRQAQLTEVAEVGGGEILSRTQRLREVEGAIRRLDNAITKYRPLKPGVAANGIRE